jgi:hypothetical protein
MCVQVKITKHSIVYRGKSKTNKSGVFEMPRELAEKLISNGVHIEIIDNEENDSTELTYAVEENNSTESTYVFEENNDTEELAVEENNDAEEKPKKKRRKKK